MASDWRKEDPEVANLVKERAALSNSGDETGKVLGGSYLRRKHGGNHRSRRRNHFHSLRSIQMLKPLEETIQQINNFIQLKSNLQSSIFSFASMARPEFAALKTL